MVSHLLEEFWSWLGLTEAEYAQERGGDREEYLFPRWTELLDGAKRMIRAGEQNAEALDAVLTVLALDHEREELLDDLEAHAGDGFLRALAERALQCGQPEARWQIAALIGRRNLRESKDVLAALARDGDGYVRKRAKNALEHMV